MPLLPSRFNIDDPIPLALLRVLPTPAQVQTAPEPNAVFVNKSVTYSDMRHAWAPKVAPRMRNLQRLKDFIYDNVPNLFYENRKRIENTHPYPSLCTDAQLLDLAHDVKRALEAQRIATAQGR